MSTYIDFYESLFIWWRYTGKIIIYNKYCIVNSFCCQFKIIIHILTSILKIGQLLPRFKRAWVYTFYYDASPCWHQSEWARCRNFTYRYHLWWQRLVMIFRRGHVSTIYFDMTTLSAWQLKKVMSSFIPTANETRSDWWTSLSLQEILRKRQCMSYNYSLY